MEISSRPTSLLRSGRKPFTVGADSENALIGGGAKKGKLSKTPLVRRALGDISNAKNAKGDKEASGGGLGRNSKVKKSTRKALGQLSTNTNNTHNANVKGPPGSGLKIHTPSVVKPTTTTHRTAFKALATPAPTPAASVTSTNDSKQRKLSSKLSQSSTSKTKQPAPRAVTTHAAAPLDERHDDEFDLEFAGRLAPLDPGFDDDSLDVDGLLKGIARANAVARCQQQDTLWSTMTPTVAPLDELFEMDFARSSNTHQHYKRGANYHEGGGGGGGRSGMMPTAVTFDFDGGGGSNMDGNCCDDDGASDDMSSGWFADGSFGIGKQRDDDNKYGSTGTAAAHGNTSNDNNSSNINNNGWFDDGCLDDLDDPWA